jgi:hypothetical protein
MASRSVRDLGFRADRMPTGMPINSQMKAAPMTTCALTTALDAMTGFRAARVWNEAHNPGQPYRSPMNRRFTNIPYWTKNGWSKPRAVLVWALAVAVYPPWVKTSYGELLGGITK